MPEAETANTTTATEGDKTTSTTEAKPVVTAAVSFKTEGEFLAAVTKKMKPELTKVAEATRAEMLSLLGVESVDDLASVKETLAKTATTKTEAERLRAAGEKTAKDLEKATKRNEALMDRIKSIARRDALSPFSSQVRDPEVLAMFATPHLEVDEDGVVTVDDGRSVDAFVTDLLKAKDYLKIPAHKDGAGTTATEPRKQADGKATKTETDATATADADKAKTTNGNGEKAEFATAGARIMADLASRNALPTLPGP